MATVVVTATAERNLRALIRSRSLPASSTERVLASLPHLEGFPLAGSPLAARWAGYRYILGPWRWLLIVYRYDGDLDRVYITAMRDAREASSPTGAR
jgi:hypothetical protein